MGRSFQEWNRAKKFSLLSEETIKCLTGVLRQNFDWDESKIDDCLMYLHSAKTHSINLEMVGVYDVSAYGTDLVLV